MHYAVLLISVAARWHVDAGLQRFYGLLKRQPARMVAAIGSPLEAQYLRSPNHDSMCKLAVSDLQHTDLLAA